jgi:hypothetical protein
MSKSSTELATLEELRPKVLIAGAAIGLTIGLLSAYLYLRHIEEEGREAKLTVGDGVRLGVTVVGLLRTISQL